MEFVKKSLIAAMTLSVLYTGVAQAQLENPRVSSLLESSAPQPPAPIAPPADTAQQSPDNCVPAPFGESLFLGGVQKSQNSIMSSEQRVARGDRVTLSVWGAVEGQQTETVDSQGFIYVKGVGPVHVEGVTEEELSASIRAQAGRVYKDDVQVYAKLEQNAGTPVLVTGGVVRPGQYFGSSQDNLVVWLQRAGGIVPQQGSYRDIRIMRNGHEVAKVDLYPFLQNGVIDQVNWVGGDVIVVGSTGQQVAVSGDVRRCAVFELSKDSSANGGTLADLTQPTPGATHAVLTGFRASQPYTEVFALGAFRNTRLMDGDRVRFYGAPQNEQITINIEGPTQGSRILVLPLHTKLSNALDMIPVNADVSDTSSVYLRRQSIAVQQQKALDESIHRLLQSALTAPASSDGEAVIRAKEAELIQNFATSAKSVKQEGRVVVMQGGKLRDLPLEDGDTIVIPQKTDVVTIEGEIMLPRAVVVKDKARAEDYVKMAGGYTERALKGDYIVIRPNGDADRGNNPVIHPGDRLLVLPKVDTKTMQTTKDIVQILYQIAVGAGVLINLGD